MWRLVFSVMACVIKIGYMYAIHGSRSYVANLINNLLPQDNIQFLTGTRVKRSSDIL